MLSNLNNLYLKCNLQFYKLPVYNKAGDILNVDVLAKQLKNITNNNDFGLPIGLLSTDNRDNWAQAYDQLIKCHTNCKNIKIIQKSLFTVSMDQIVCFNEANKYAVLGKQLIHGGGSKENSANRWMDKTIQVFLYITRKKKVYFRTTILRLVISKINFSIMINIFN